MSFNVTAEKIVIIKILLSLFLIIFFFVLHFFTLRLVNKKTNDLKKKHINRKIAHYVYLLSAILVLSFIWLQHRSAMTTLLAISGAGLVVALQEAILSVFGGIVILAQDLYHAGNRIEINQVKGDVIDVSLLYTTMVEVDNWVSDDQSTGRITRLPNNLIFKNPVHNYNKGFPYIWNEIKILLTFESNWQKASEILLELASEHDTNIKEFTESIKKLSAKYMIYFSKLTPIVYTKIKESGIELSLRHLTAVKERRTVSSEIQEKILECFAKEPEIDFAYPTIRYYSGGDHQHD